MVAINSQFKQFCNDKIYYIERDEYGHVIIILRDIYVKKFAPNEQKYFIQHIIDIVNNSLKISKKYDNNTCFVHIYLEKCNPKQYSHKFFKRINAILLERFEDILDKCFVYSKSKMFSFIWNIVRNFLDKDVRTKIVHMQ